VINLDIKENFVSEYTENHQKTTRKSRFTKKTAVSVLN